MTWDLDDSLSRIFRALEELQIEGNTYIVFMSDNGAAGNRQRANNKPLFAGKGTLHEGGIRVPLIISGPGVRPAYRSEAVSGTDLLATFATWAGITVEPKESEDLAPLLEGSPEQFERDLPMLFHYPHYGKGPLQKPQTALVSNDWKLLRDWETGSDQLYDLDSDLGETNDLSSAEPEIFNALLAAMNKRLDEVDAQIPTANPDFDPTAEPRGQKRKR